MLKGDDPEKVLERDGIARYLWRSFTAAGGLGLYLESTINAFDNSGNSSTPVGSIVTQAVQTVPALKDIATGEGDQNDWNKLFRGLLMAGTGAGIYSSNPWVSGVGAGVSIARPMLEKALVPNERQEQTSFFGR